MSRKSYFITPGVGVGVTDGINGGKIFNIYVKGLKISIPFDLFELYLVERYSNWSEIHSAPSTPLVMSYRSRRQTYFLFYFYFKDLFPCW